MNSLQNSKYNFKSPGLKLLLVCALVLLMTIPAMFIFVIIYDRSTRADQISTEIAFAAGGAQKIVGPILAVPVETMDSDGIWSTNNTIFVFANTGEVLADVDVSTKKKSLYSVQVYESDLSFKAEFDLGKLQSLNDNNKKILINQALILLQVSDLRGALSDAELTLEDGTTHVFSPESLNRGYGSGQYISASIPNLADNGSLKVSATLRLGGAKQISIIPFAKSTKIRIVSNWPHPGFSGDYLPDNKQISDNGFVGSRTIPKLASGLPDTLSITAWNKFSQQEKGMNVSFVSLSSPYQFVSRSLKYALLFIGLVFLTFFLFEMSNKRPVHAAQYVLVGLAQTVFYLLLLAFSEHIGFDLAFAIAAIAVVAMTGLYAGAVFGKKQTVTALLLFSGVYLLLFVLMRLVDYALIVGAVASLIGIATTMYMTRNLQWYGSGNDK